jgi:hypothetical protein
LWCDRSMPSAPGGSSPDGSEGAADPSGAGPHAARTSAHKAAATGQRKVRTILASIREVPFFFR